MQLGRISFGALLGALSLMTFSIPSGAAPVAADLGLTITAPATATDGQPIDYTITISNAGPDAATNTMVVDTLPAGVSFISATPPAGTTNSFTGGTDIWTIGTLTMGTIDTFTIVAEVMASPGSLISDTATASADDSESASFTVETTVAATPLPATFPLFAGGLGFVGYLTRRKKRVQTIAAA